MGGLSPPGVGGRGSQRTGRARELTDGRVCTCVFCVFQLCGDRKVLLCLHLVSQQEKTCPEAPVIF